MAIQLTELKYDKNKSPEENITTIIKYVNSMATTLNYTLNNFDAADVTTSSGVSLQDLYTAGALKGDPGRDGKDGKDGKDGIGVPAGGTTGQVLVKNSDTDFDTKWMNLSDIT